MMEGKGNNEKERDFSFFECVSDDEYNIGDPLLNMITRASLMKRTEPVDKEETISLVRAAIGDRSMRKFAEEIGVNPSSISRILNGTSTEIRTSLIAFIAYNADPKSEVTMDKLLRAQGFTKPEERRGVGKRDRWESKQPICDELLIRGHSVQYVEEMPQWIIWPSLPTYILRTDAFADGKGKWYFIDKLCKKIKKVSINMMQGWLDSIMASYYRGLEAKRVSIVTDSGDIFYGLKKLSERYRIKDEISIILLSMDDGKIYDEYVIPLEDGTVPESVITGTIESK